MKIFGITGGTGSGKSTVSAMLKELGADIIDTDKISRLVTAEGSECLAELTKAFGSGILFENGELNRKKLAQIAFADAEKTELLSRITHKYIKSETLRRISASDASIIGIDGAVIIGSEIEPLCQKIVLVTAERDVRKARIMQRDGMTDEEAEKRINAQPSDSFYREHTDYVINNSFDEAALGGQVKELYNKLKGDLLVEQTV